MRILLAEDTDSRDALVERLEKLGHDAMDYGCNGKAFVWLMRVQEADEKAFDLLITDFQMPSMSGGELITAATESGVLPPRVILHTSLIDADIEVQNLRAKGLQFDLVTKPDLKSLWDTIAKVKIP